MKILRFDDLEIWKISIEIALEIYKLSNKGKFLKDFGLRDQIRRAIVSVSSNIAEGFEMGNNNDLIRFLRIAKGSTGEVRSQLFIALKLNYITNNEFSNIDNKLELVSLKIGKFISYLMKKKNDKEFKTR